MSEEHNKESKELLKKEKEMLSYGQQLNDLEEKITSHTRQIKKQQEELEDCYSSDQSLAEPLHKMRREIRKKEETEKNIFDDIRKAIRVNLTHINDQRKPTKENQEET